MKKKLTTEEDYRQRVDRVCMYIREHLDKEIDMRRLAVLSAFSPFHFHRIMRAYLKEPIGAFIIRTRVETAAKLLRYTDLPVADIAYRVGYDTPSSLTKSFCKFFALAAYVRNLTMFLRDFCMASWNADRLKDAEIEKIKKRLDALEGK